VCSLLKGGAGFIFSVHFQCPFSMFIFNVHFQCSFLLFIVHCSLFIVHCSLFIVHCSLFIPDQTFEMLLIGLVVKIRSKNLIRVWFKKIYIFRSHFKVWSKKFPIKVMSKYFDRGLIIIIMYFILRILLQQRSSILLEKRFRFVFVFLWMWMIFW
jgi:hypothetical protein